MIENGLNKKAIIGKHLGEPLCLWTACGCHVDTTGGGGRGSGQRWRRKGGDGERRKRDTEIDSGGWGGESCTAPPAV